MSPGDDRPAGPRRAPTMEDVAADAGVSRALVSIVFRDQPGASEATRTRVRQSATRLGYAPDQRARLLSRRRSQLVGVVFGLGLEFHAELVEALYGAADREGYELAVGGWAPTRDEERAVRALLAYRCEALILVGSGLPSATMAELAQRVPTVAVARAAVGAGADVVRTDDVAGARLAAEHLLGLGHRRLAYLDGGTAPGASERRRGYADALDAAALSGALVLDGGLTEEDGVRAGRALLAADAGGTGPTGVLAFNDHCALGTLHTLRDGGLRVPEDVSVVGYDDTRVAQLPWAQLTTVRQDTVQLASWALKLALTRTRPGPTPKEAEPQEVVVAPALVTRATTDASP